MLRRTRNPADTLGSPPGPRLPKLVQTILAVRDPVGFLEKCRRKYGDVFRVRAVGSPVIVYVADPALAQQVLTTDRDIGRAGAARKPYLEPITGPNGLVCLDGDDWTRQRKLLGAAFHGKRIARYREEISTITAERVERWPTRRELAMRPCMQEVTLEVILRIVFGVRDGARIDRLRAMLPPLLHAWEHVDSLIMALPDPVWRGVEWLLSRVPGTPVATFANLRLKTDELVYAEIAERRAASDLADRHDILSVLLHAVDDEGTSMSDAELRDALMTLVVAGHETTSTGLAWTFERLVRNPEVLSRLRASLSDGDEQYLLAVIKETLRTRPVGPDMPRLLTDRFELGEYALPAGWWVNPSTTLLHNSDEHFPQPEAFRPERFLGDEKASPAWMPFGGGRRKCLGWQLALLEMQAIIPEVLARYQLHTGRDARPEALRMRNVTLAPSRDGQFVAERV